MRKAKIGQTAVLGAATALLMGAGVAAASPSGAATAPRAATGSAHRPGVMGTVAQAAHDRAARTAARATAAAATGPNTLAYGGGINGAGVMSGAKTKVYLVFLGNQWGAQSTDANGNAKFSGDPSGAAAAAQQMFKGIGTNNETWSADLTQWCDGAGVATGAISCPANLPASQFVPYQAGGVLSGVWYDNVTYPATPNGHALGTVAVNAAAHFGNTTAASNRDAYYVILSPHGTNPDGYQDPNTGYCAWHDWNGDSQYLSGGPVNSPYGNIAFSNQPYNIDMGQTCGTNFVNAGGAGTLDGYTMTLGHEWHEMVSDVYPNTGWANPGTTGGTAGYENSDECAWIQPGAAGGAANINFGSHGSYAEQASWSNDTNSCAISHAILNHGGGGLNGTHVLTVSGTGQVLDDPGSSTVAGTQLITWVKNGGANQSWVFTQQSDGSYTIVNSASKLCADDNGGGTTAGTKVIQWTCTGSSNQHWKVTQLSSGGYTITNVYSGLLLTTASTANGALVTQQANTNSALQHWTVS